MDSLTIEGDRYTANFQQVERKEDSSNEDAIDVASGNFNCWADPKMWWKGNVIIIDKTDGRDVRALF